MIPTKWHSALIDQSVDPDLSEEVDLQGNFEFLSVIQPELDGAHSVTVHIARESDGTYYPTYTLKRESLGDYPQSSSALATTRAFIFCIGGAQFVKIAVSTSVSTDKTFYVRGFNRG